MVATIISGLTAQIDWLGLRTGSHLVESVCIH